MSILFVLDTAKIPRSPIGLAAKIVASKCYINFDKILNNLITYFG